MKKWIAIEGNFVQESNKIKFVGGENDYTDTISGETKKGTKYGMILFEDLFFNGTIETIIEFDELDEGDEAEIMLNFSDDYNFSCIGISNNLLKYEYKSFYGQWKLEKAMSKINLESKTKYSIKVEIIGSVITLYINNIKVFTTYSKTVFNRTNAGFWAKSKSKIIIHDYKMDYEKPTAFVVMQYGKNYDDLYYDVILKVCEKNGYNVYRADEGVGTGLILNDIIESIKNSSIIIADISPNNPNVFYEIGFSHALNKPTILLNEKNIRDHLPFDVSGFRTIFYDNSIGGKKEVEDKLEKFIRNINANIPSTSITSK